MSAEVLRRAAALMRERAEAATPGPWQVTEDVDTGERFVYDTRRTELAQVAEWSTGLGNPRHIASWHPAVALAVADWLDATAHRVDMGKPRRGGVAPGRNNHSWRGSREALKVARAYLGEQP